MWKSHNFAESLCRKVFQHVNFHVDLSSTWGCTSLLWHLACQLCILIVRLLHLPNTLPAMMEMKICARMKKIDAKTCKCVRVTNEDESAFGVNIHADVPHTVPIHERMHAQTKTPWHHCKGKGRKGAWRLDEANFIGSHDKQNTLHLKYEWH